MVRIRRVSPFYLRTATVFSILVLAQAVCAQAPARLTDKDIASLMANLKNDTKTFRSRFDSAVKKSTIRKTSQEKDAKNLVASFQNQIGAMGKNFKQSKKAENLPSIMTSSDQIDKLVNDLKLDPQTAASWQKVRQELTQLSGAFGVTPSKQSANSAVYAEGVPCLQAAGAERSKKLVDECLQVSAATHLPCNSQNSCTLIIDEIKRSCGLLGNTVPGFCGEYTR